MSEIPHTLSEFENGLQRTRELVQLALSAARQNLDHAIQGVSGRDGGLLSAAISGEDAVDRKEREIGELGMEILLRFDPLATDLRSVLGAIRISADIERISDAAVSIAQRGTNLLERPEVVESRWIEPLYTEISGLLADAGKSFSEKDIELALGLHDRDQKFDKRHRKVIKSLTKAMETDVANLRSYLDLVFIVQRLERIGDHAVNIGESVVYIHKAVDIRHVGPSALEED